MAAQTGLQAPGSTSSHMQYLNGALYSWTMDSLHLYGAAVGVGTHLVIYRFLLEVAVSLALSAFSCSLHTTAAALT